ILGDNHPKSLKSMAELFCNYTDSGQLEWAEELGVVVVNKQKEDLGDNDHLTLRTMSQLAITYNHLKKFKEAEEVGVAAMNKQK
ncbi:hypothetical protein B0H13DRAFT_1454476, partial [Mycena leptocephala]